MPHAGAGQGRFTPGVARSHNDDIIMGWVSIQKRVLNPWEGYMFHVKHIPIEFPKNLQNDFFSTTGKRICQLLFHFVLPLAKKGGLYIKLPS
jgi:hypothetical protein